MIQSQPPQPLDPPEAAEAAQAQAEAADREAQDHAAMRFLACDADGRHFLRLVMDWTGLLAPSGSERREGERDVGRRLMLLMDGVDPLLFPSLLADRAAMEAERRSAGKRAPT